MKTTVMAALSPTTDYETEEAILKGNKWLKPQNNKTFFAWAICLSDDQLISSLHNPVTFSRLMFKKQLLAVTIFLFYEAKDNCV